MIRTILIFAALSAAAQAAEPLVPYDNFNPGEPQPPTPTRVQGIDWSRWSARDVGAGTARVRKQAGLSLRLQQDVTSTGAFGVSLPTPAVVTRLQATTRVVRAKATGCGTNAAEAAVQVGGRFFNSGLPVLGTALGDVQAWIRVVRHSTDAQHRQPFHVEAVVERCDDRGCSGTTRLFTAALGDVAEEGLAKLEVTWDKTAHRFVFTRDGKTSAAFPYTLTDAKPPGSPLKSIELSMRAPTHCPTAQASMNAYVRDVLVNEAAAPTF